MGIIKVLNPTYSLDTPLKTRALGWSNRAVSGQVRDASLSMSDSLESIENSLRGRLLYVPEAQATISRWAALFVAMLIPALGIIKVLVEISRDGPVGILIPLCIATVAPNFSVFGRKIRRSSYGDKVFANLREKHQQLQALNAHLKTATFDEVFVGIGMFGNGLLANSALSHIPYVLRPVPQISVSGDVASGCGGGGASCGGGGGGGGGGCGGCGGGGH